MHKPEGRQDRRKVHLYRQSTSARCITVMYHSPNRWGESHKTAVTLTKARFLTSIVGSQAERCDDVSSVVLQPPEILKVSTLWDITNLHSLFDSHHVVLSMTA